LDDGTHTVAANARSRPLRPWRHAATAAVACAGIVLSVVLFAGLRDRERDRVQIDFQRAAEDRVAALWKDISSHLLIMESIRSFYASSQKVGRSEFQAFVTPLLQHHPNIQALEWIPRVHHSERAAYEAAARQDGYPHFQITERQMQGHMVKASRREEYFPVFFVEPYKGNEAALGFDLASSLVRLDALVRARDTGRMAATAKLTLVQETGTQLGLLIFLPVYRPGAPIETMEDRWRNLEGFVLGVYRIGDTIERALAPLTPAGVDVCLYDRSAPEGEQLLYLHPSRLRKSPVTLIDPRTRGLGAALHHSATGVLGGREWTVVCTPTPEFVAARMTWWPWIGLSGGLLATGLLVAYLLSSTVRNARTRQLAAQLLQTNRELQREIAERKRLEEQLRRSRDELEQRVAERTAALYEANKQLKQAQVELVQSEKMSMLGQLATGVAHEINTPTGAILNMAADMEGHLQALVELELHLSDLPAETLRWLRGILPGVLADSHIISHASARTELRRTEQALRGAGVPRHERVASALVNCGLGEIPADDPMLQHFTHEPVLSLLEHVSALRLSAEIFLNSARRIARIVRALRYYARTQEKEVVDIDVNESVDTTLVILQNRIKHIADVRTNFARDLPSVRCGPDLSQVWTNILNNACDAIEESHKGGLGLIEIATKPEGDSVVVAISNNGRPVPEEILQRIYDPFFTTKPVGKGTGLGLSICAGILRRHGGTIAARNDPGRVTFQVRLLVAASARPEGRRSGAKGLATPADIGRGT